nr:hypothetical protein [uncultured Sphingomonas sp.]
MSEFLEFFDKHSNVGRQILWEHTIYQVAFLFRAAEERIRESHRQAYYFALDGWWRSKTCKMKDDQHYRIPEETAISEAFICEMENAQREIILDPNASPDLANIDSLSFAVEQPRRQKKGIGRKAKPTDFRFYRSGLGDVDVRIEAKVLVNSSDLSSEYLSKSRGIGRFSDPIEPYTDELVGGMVAYTFTEDRTRWESRISAAMSSLSISSFQHAMPQDGRSVLFARVPYTHANTPPQSEVLVFNLVMELECDPSART